MNELSAKERIFGLDFLRAGAIIMVLCSHILWIYPNYDNDFVKILQMFGFWGVELFFVLSGYLIGSIIYKNFIEKEFNFKDVLSFVKRRWFRTLPNYYLVLIINIAIGFYIGYEMVGLNKYFFFFQNFSQTMTPFFPESWSLSVEEFTYIILPITLFLSTFFAFKDKSKRFLFVTILLILFFFVFKIIYNFTTTNTTLTQWNISLKAVVIYRIDSILIGVLAAWLHQNYSVQWNKNKLNFLFLGLLMMLFFIAGVGFLGISIEKFPFFLECTLYSF